MTSQTFYDFMVDASDNHFQSEANSILFFKQDLLHLKVTSYKHNVCQVKTRESLIIHYCYCTHYFLFIIYFEGKNSEPHQVNPQCLSKSQLIAHKTTVFLFFLGGGGSVLY